MVQLARLLKALKIAPGTIRMDDGQTPKGYHRRAFDDAWARYLSRDPPVQTATTPQPLSDKAFGDSPKRHNEHCRAACGFSQNGYKPLRDNGCGDVAFSDPGAEEADMGALFEERAAIGEYERGLSRNDAERLAAVDLGWR
jgi:hypothetical protein